MPSEPHGRYERQESEAERLDRNYLEMLQELRVLQAGIQILFAFLLSLAFQSRFRAVTDYQRDVYVVTMVTTALAMACLSAPVPYHRLVFRRGMKDDLVKAATRYISVGLGLLFVSICGAVLLVLDFLVSRALATSLVIVVAAVFAVTWVVLPLIARARARDDEQDPPT